MWQRVRSLLCATGLVIVCSVLSAGETIAGPPFRTDDPVPVAFGYYELYTAAIGTHWRAAQRRTHLWPHSQRPAANRRGSGLR